MATLVLGTAGAAIGGALLPGFSALGGAVTGATLGRAAGALAGAYIDNALFQPSGQSRQVEGPRLDDLKVMSSSEGVPIPRLYGRMRLAGEIIWATRFEEEVVTSTASASAGGGGKGLGGAEGNGTTTTEYRYYANLAVGICEGPVTRIGRVWADGKPLGLSRITMRVYKGTASQQPDSLIEGKEGAGRAPAYRGLAYVVFERLALARFGNRIPQLTFEVFRAVDRFEESIRSVTIIPGASEFAYEPDAVTQDQGGGATIAENVHTHAGGSDWDASIDELGDSLPALARASLVVSWFGNDLRAGECMLRPGVENRTKQTAPVTWQVAGETRATAHLVSAIEDRPAYGGTPSDSSVVAAIRDLKARGLAVTFYPFVLMDVPEGNALADPYGAASQAVYPWRGRITLSTAPGEPGSPDGSTAAAAEIAAFVGTAETTDFAVSGDTVVYAGPAEWSFRRMILHYAHLCKAAGGVDAFLIGSELRGLTTVRSAPSTYPFVDALVALAADVKSVLGSGTKVTYAADWSEYFGHQPADGSGDVHFHLDPLWASPSIDAVGIDLYWPLADWRDGTSHLDRLAGASAIHDLAYLRANVFGGEGFDWYYASKADRDAQLRTPITDGAGKPWVFRYKDIRAWWQSRHYDRPGGIEGATPTAWQPRMKPIWLTEVGCPAIDKGPNEPNVFVDPKSSESKVPHYSLGLRDDLVQRRYIEAIVSAFDPAHDDFDPAYNPQSDVYAGRMVDPSRIYVYTWDARPYPAFPEATSLWADGANWTVGHWLTGRLGAGSVAAVIAAILTDYGFSRFAVGPLAGSIAGYALDRPMSARDALQPLELAFMIDARETADGIVFAPRGGDGSALSLRQDDVVEQSAEGALFALTRAQESELPAIARIGFIDPAADYRRSAVEARRSTVASRRISVAELAIAMRGETAQAIAETWLQDTWASRESARFALSPRHLALEPGDVVLLEDAGRSLPMRITGIAEGLHAEVEALSIEPGIVGPVITAVRPGTVDLPEVFGPALAVFLDLPLVTAEGLAHRGLVAATASPWPGGIAVYRGHGAGEPAYALDAIVTAPATLGVTLEALAPGPESRFDRANALTVRLDGGVLHGASEADLLNGTNLAAIETASGRWELLQFAAAELVAPSTYRLTTLLRGQSGSEAAMATTIGAGARFVLVDAALERLAMSVDEIGLDFSWRFGPAVEAIDHRAYRTETHAFAGAALRPLSPVHVSGRREGGDLHITWVRRTRIGGDSLDLAEVPLGEEDERYEIDILEGSVVRRTLVAASPSAVYAAAEQAADFGMLPGSVTLEVCQVSPVHGRGTPRRAVL
ncbi:MAG: glycoside hydrolase/phage tail family protein [Hyphomicrobiaceae bacterium]